MSFSTRLYKSLKAGLANLSASEREVLRLLWQYPNFPLKYLPTKAGRKPSNEIWLRVGSLGKRKLWRLMPPDIKRGIPRIRRKTGTKPFYSGVLVEMYYVLDSRRRRWAVFELLDEAVRALQELNVIGRKPHPPLAQYKPIEDDGVPQGFSTPAETKRVNQSIIARRGQLNFRKELLSAYERRCAVTGCDETRVLEAAHITGFRSRGHYEAKNGLLLRADWHTLYDLGLWAIHPKRNRVVLSPSVIDRHLRSFESKPLRLPRDPQHAPDQQALERRYKRFLKSL
jgi:hypothetical protein